MMEFYYFLVEKGEKFFWLILLFLMVFCAGIGFALYKYYDKSAYLNESILLYEALNADEPSLTLREVYERKVEPYSTVAGMYLSKAEGENPLGLYEYISLKGSIVYIKDLASINLALLKGSELSSEHYPSTVFFLKSLEQLRSGDIEGFKKSLQVIMNDVNLKPYLKDICRKLLVSVG